MSAEVESHVSPRRQFSRRIRYGVRCTSSLADSPHGQIYRRRARGQRRPEFGNSTWLTVFARTFLHRWRFRFGFNCTRPKCSEWLRRITMDGLPTELVKLCRLASMAECGDHFWASVPALGLWAAFWSRSAGAGPAGVQRHTTFWKMPGRRTCKREYEIVVRIAGHRRPSFRAVANAAYGQLKGPESRRANRVNVGAGLLRCHPPLDTLDGLVRFRFARSLVKKTYRAANRIAHVPMFEVPASAIDLG